MAGRSASLGHGDLTPRPGAPQLDRPSRTVVPRSCLLEVVQHVLRAVSRPHRESVMIVVPEAAAATHGDEPRIPDLGEDHQCLPISLLCPPRVVGSASDEPASLWSVTLPQARVMTEERARPFAIGYRLLAQTEVASHGGGDKAADGAFPNPATRGSQL